MGFLALRSAVLPVRGRLDLYAAAGASVLGVGLSALVVPGLAGVLGGGLAVVMIAIARHDARHFIIPDVLVLIGIGMGLFNACTAASDGVLVELAGAIGRGLVLALAFWGVRRGYKWIRGRPGIGLGDVKLAMVAGIWLGWMAMAVAVEIAALAALAAVAILALRGRSVTRRTRVPFGLFFAPAIWIAWLLQAVVLQAGF